jgi:RNA-directed DNA polymerase
MNITQRNNFCPAQQKQQKIVPILMGWVNYFSIGKAKSMMQSLDEYIGTRLRMGLWKDWKNCRTSVANLLKLRATKQKTY